MRRRQILSVDTNAPPATGTLSFMASRSAPDIVAPPHRRAGLTWGGAVVLGLALMVFTVPWLYDWQDVDAMPEAEVIAATGYLTWQLLTGMAGLAALAWRLWRGAGWADYVVIFCGMLSPLVVVPGLVLLVSVVSRMQGWSTVAALSCAVAATGLEAHMNPTPVSDGGLWLFLGVFVLTVILAGVWVGRRRERREYAAERTADKLRSADLKARTARSEERARIARDLHDTLSHRLSLIALHAGALSYRDDLSGPQVRNATGVLRDQAEQATQDLRQVLTVLRADEAVIDPSTGVRDLVSSAREVGTPVDVDDASLELADAAGGLPTLSAHAVHRTIQETLTNARKHAPGKPVTLRLWIEEGSLIVDVANPITPAHEVEEPGVGLVGLAERAELCGGRLRVMKAERFVVRLEVPWEGR